jgi:uncharacterized membrane protein SirB2
MKHLHLLFIALSLISFLGRIALTKFRPEMMQLKWVNIAPHAINGAVILTGISLVFQGHWQDGEFGWIVAKIIALLGYVALGIMALKLPDEKRWYAFGGALLVFIYIAKVAVTKSAMFF